MDQALRARANAFLDYESKGDFRKAYDLVAEDSKDYYFGATKEKSASFTIDEVQYGADLSTATVKSTMKRQTMLAGHPVEVPQLLISRWKLEKGEWVWYHDPSKDVTKTIIGELPSRPGGDNYRVAASEGSKPKGWRWRRRRRSSPPGQPSIRRKSYSSWARKATEQVTFHNSNPGPFRVYAEVRGVADTITVEPNNIMVNPQADAPFKITYKPRPESPLQGRVLFTLEPFGSVYVLPVRIARERQIRKPAAAPVAPADAVPAPAVP